MKRPDSWTPAEDFIIRQSANMTARQMMELLPNRTMKAIAQRRLNLGDRPEYRQEWTDTEDRAITRMMSEGKTLGQIATAVGRTYRAVRARAAWLKANAVADEAEKPPVDPWASLPADAFKDYRVSADPRTSIAKPESRTGGGVAW